MADLCPNCEFNNPTGMRFCGNCGSRLVVVDAPVAEKQPPQPEDLGVMVGSDLKERFRKAGLQAEGQRRNVTVLFADLADYSNLSGKLDPEDLYEIIQRFVQMLAGSVYKFDGMVDKFIGDGLMALFGAPISYENNAERAIHAALDMHTGLAGLNQTLKAEHAIQLQMRIGLNAGTVIVGSIGSDMLMDYTAIGETVNLAQRFESVAGLGEILVSETVHHQTQALFDYEPRPGLTLKGITKPVTGYRVLREKPDPHSVRGLDGLRAPMVGRAKELKQLENISQTLLEDKTGHFVLIQGEAGIGKSRLISELKILVKAQNIQVFQGQSLTYRKSIAYWMFRDVLRNYLGVTSDTPEKTIREKLNQRIPKIMAHQAQEVLPFLEYLLSITPSTPDFLERFSFLDANQFRQQFFIALRNWLIAEAKNCPVLLILDDLHWADDASLELIRFLIDSLDKTPLILCGITRPFEAGLLAQIEQEAEKALGRNYSDIRIQSLPPDQSEKLFQELLIIPDLPLSLRNQIIQRAAGIPFYLEEILRMLIDNKIIYFEDGHWKLNPEAEETTLGVPDNLQALILTRFDRLTPGYRRILQVASVIGREFSVPVLADVLGVQDIHLEVDLSELATRAFIEPRLGSGLLEFTFRHALTSEAIYSTLLRRERGDLHGQIGEAIEKIYPERVTELAYLLARHFSWSQRLEKALHYLILAGQRAARDYLNTQAQDYYERALNILPKVDYQSSQALNVYMGLGDLQVFTGVYENARENYRLAQDYINATDPQQIEGYVVLRRKISTTFERLGNFDRALEHLDAAQNIIQFADISMPIESANVLSDMGWIHFRRGELDIAERNLSTALELVKDTQQFDLISSIYNRLGGIYYQKDELEQASNFVRKSLVLREEIGDFGAVARSYNNLGLLAWKRGDWDEALEDFSRSVELNQNLGDVEAMIFLHNNIGLLQTDRGNLEIARSHLEESLVRAQRIGHIALEGDTYLHYSRYWLAAKEWEKSLFYSNRALEIFNEIGSQEKLVDLYTSNGEAWLGLGEMSRSQQEVQKALEFLEDGPEASVSSLGRGRILRLLGKIKLQQYEYQAAARDLADSLQIFIDLNNQLELGRTRCELALLERLQGKYANARIHAREARLVFLKLGASLDMEKAEGLMV